MIKRLPFVVTFWRLCDPSGFRMLDHVLHRTLSTHHVTVMTGPRGGYGLTAGTIVFGSGFRAYDTHIRVRGHVPASYLAGWHYCDTSRIVPNRIFDRLRWNCAQSAAWWIGIECWSLMLTPGILQRYLSTEGWQTHDQQSARAWLGLEEDTSAVDSGGSD